MAEYLVNGDFANGSTDWTLNGASVIDSKLVTDGTAGAWSYMASQALPEGMDLGATYTISFDIEAFDYNYAWIILGDVDQTVNIESGHVEIELSGFTLLDNFHFGSENPAIINTFDNFSVDGPGTPVPPTGGITVNGSVVADGDPLLVNGVQATTVTVNGVAVWRNNYVADAPTLFTASDGLESVLNFSWTLPADQGVPPCSYEVYEGTTLRATAAVGATTASWNTGGAYSGTFHVVGVNTAGSSVASNTDEGNSTAPYVGPPSPVIITGNRTLVAGTDFPADTTINVCLCGGGGNAVDASGGFGNTYGGGYAGAVESNTQSFTHGTSVTATIGAEKGSTTFGNLTGAGGSAGNSSGSYAGNGGSRTTCGGTGSDGSTGTSAYNTQRGGQSSGFGDGGDGTGNGTGQVGGVGSGGGASERGGLGGGGGRGQINLSW